MDKISLIEEKDNFNWEIPTGLSVNKKIQTPSNFKVYSHEEYAPQLYEFYFGRNSGNLEFSKDLVEGEIYKCTISSVNEDRALAYTASGQTIFIDLKKEVKEAQKLNIQGIDFSVLSQVDAIVREIDGTYYGSVIKCYVQGLRTEFFAQIKDASHAYPARIESINKGGYLVDISGVKCFLPGSLAAANKITDFESYLGKTIYVMIDGYVPAKDIFVVSYKKYLSKIIDQKIKELDLTRKYKGCVTGSSSFGLFIEWDEIYTGLIHKAEFENEVVQGFNAGDEVEFYVKEIKEDNKLTLSFNPPSEKVLKMYQVKEDLDNGSVSPMAAIVKRKKNGCLVEIPEVGSMAMIPQDQMTSDLKSAKAGDRIAVLIYEINPLEGKIFAKPADV